VLRPLRLAGVAARAEALRSRHHAKRWASKIVYAIGALLLLLLAIFWLHVALWHWLRGMFNHQEAALIIGGVDVLLTAIFAFLATRSAPRRLENEAREVRDMAIQDATRMPRIAGSLGSLLPIVAPLLLSRFRRK
jgi:uncharacterized membrane protein